MKQTIAAVLVLAGLAAATGQDTVKLPQVEFLVTDIVPGTAKGTKGETRWWQSPYSKNYHNYADARYTQWFVHYAIAGRSETSCVRLRKTGSRLPTRQQIRLIIRTAERLQQEKPRFAPKALDRLLGYYPKQKPKPRRPSPTIKPSSSQPTGS